MKTLKFALVGCGRIAKRHAELLGKGQIDGAQLSAVCDHKEEKARTMGETYRVPYYTDMDEMMHNEDVDLVCVLTPSGDHAEHVIHLSYHKKDILVEKPMALTLDDADAMIKACNENGCRLFVVKQNRFNVPVMKLREAVEENRFDQLVLGTVRVRWCRDQGYYNLDEWRGTWSRDGGVLTNQASHHIDMLAWMMGDVESVFAKSTTALVDIETEDTAVVTIKFKNGALGIIEATTAARPKNLEGSISILGAGGTVIIGGFAVNEMTTWNFTKERAEDQDVLQKYSVNPPDVYGFGHHAYYQHITNCIRHNQPHMVDGAEGRKCIEIITAIYESIETGKEVFLPFRPEKCKLGRAG